MGTLAVLGLELEDEAAGSGARDIDPDVPEITFGASDIFISSCEERDVCKKNS